MPNPLPYYPFYPNDFDLSQAVRSMSLAERGLYVCCLNLQWRDGAIPDDLLKIARYVGCDAREIRYAWPKVRSCFQVAIGGQLVNNRLAIERQKASNKSASAVESAKLGSERRHNRTDTYKKEASSITKKPEYGDLPEWKPNYK